MGQIKKKKSAPNVIYNKNSRCTSICNPDQINKIEVGKSSEVFPQNLSEQVKQKLKEINTYIDNYFKQSSVTDLEKIDITQLLFDTENDEQLKKFCYNITNFILYSYFEKLYNKAFEERENKRSIKLGNKLYKLCLKLTEIPRNCNDTESLFNMLYLQIPNMLTISWKKIQTKLKDITKKMFWYKFIYDPNTIKTLYDVTLLMLQYNIKINSTEEWAKAWYQQQTNPKARTIETFKRNQLDTLFYDQYNIFRKVGEGKLPRDQYNVYKDSYTKRDIDDLKSIRDNIEKYHNVNAISILNHLLIFEKTKDCAVEPIERTEEEKYLNLINVCN